MSGSISNFPVFVFINFSEIKITGRSVGEDDSDAVLSGVLGKARFLSSIVLVASESRQEVELRVGFRVALLADLVFREEDVKFHSTSENLTLVFDRLEDSTMQFHAVSNFGCNCLILFVISNLKDSTEAFSTVESVNKALNVIQTIKVMSDKFVDRKFAKHDFVD
jgi:hypothetical protein